MTRQSLISLIRERRSYLIVGLDTDIDRIPRHLLSLPDPVLAFNRAIIDATQGLCVGYKINTAFYESRGARGWECLSQTLDYIPKELFRIADAKRGDIGNTSDHYARTFFEVYPFDAVTVSPYMGKDSITPFLEYPGKWTILLALTSNPGSADFQKEPGRNGALYEQVLREAGSWGSPDNLMFVVGATRSDQMERIRGVVPEHFLLVPGVGPQGGDLTEISRKGLNKDCGLLVNVSRAILYAGPGEDFALKAQQAAAGYQQQMDGLLKLVFQP